MAKPNLIETSSQFAASGDLTGKVWRIRIIEGDRQGSSAYYPKEALDAGKHLFGKGVRMFKNHPSSEEQWSQPERRAEDIVGYISSEAVFDGKDLWADATFFETDREWIRERAEAGVIAVSIRAAGEMTEGTDGPVLKRLTHVYSVDVVTQAGAGGAFGEVLESARDSDPAEAEGLAEAQQEEEKMDLPKEFLEALDGLNSGMKALTERLEAAAKPAEPAAPLDESAPKAPKFAEIDAALNEAELSAAGRASVLRAIEGGADLAESIKTVKDAEAEIRESIKASEFKGHEMQESGAEDFKFSGMFGN